MPGPQAPRERAANSAGRAAIERRLVEDHIPFVRSLARKLRDHVPMVEFDDLVGFGMQGLIEAAQRFDDRHGVAFTTFAYYRVRGSMFDGLRSMGWLPRGEYARLRMEERASSYAQNLASRTEETPPPAGQEAGVEQRVREISTALSSVATIFVTLLAREDEQQLSDDRAAPHEQLERHQLAERVRKAIRKLPDKERRLLDLYYFQDQTLEQAGAAMGLSKSWTSRLHARAIALLREILEAEGVS
ncbi:MAG TPA: sigma-70 family RNA polymerase sigma factor [Pseudomonadota bacterium]|nr:sigma-70 family RNA polymerase sigma factor [Pseudomonadota bacterium]